MIVVVDYGSGNLRSVSKALEYLGASVKVSSKPVDIEVSEKVVLPGVGAFGDAVGALKDLKLFEVIKAHIQNEKPFLGICLGLQLLFTESEESPGIEGLGVFKGKVSRFHSRNIKVPHIGWNQVEFLKEHPLLENVLNPSYFYFDHSYYAVPETEALVAGRCEHGDDKVTAILADRNIFATQFHPEKSQGAGLTILKNFISWRITS